MQDHKSKLQSGSSKTSLCKDHPIKSVANYIKPTATWGMHLWVECPFCREDIDLLDDFEYIASIGLEIGEHDTKRTKNIDADCPHCGHDFIIENVEY